MLRLMKSSGPISAPMSLAPSMPRAQLQTRDLRLGQSRIVFATPNLDAQALRDYSMHFADKDLWFERAARTALGSITRSQEVARADELERTEYYQDWCRRIEIYHAAGSVFLTAEESVGLGIHRTRSHSPFEDDEKRRISAFLPHL